MKNKIKMLTLLFVVSLPYGTTVNAQKNIKNKLPFQGSYSWSFEVPTMGEQTSTFIFFQDSIQAIMKGETFSADYTHKIISYNPKEQRCITVGMGISKGETALKDHIYSVLFFKDINKKSVTIYRHECKNGLEEAKSFSLPAADAQTDHGWNVYYKNDK